MPRSTVIKKRVTWEISLTLLMRSSATIMPSGSEKISVRKKMAQVLPRPSLILSIMVINDMWKPSFYLYNQNGPKAQLMPRFRVLSVMD